MNFLSLEKASPEKKPLTLAEVRALIHERWAKDQSLLARDQKRLFEYLAKFVKVKDADACRKAVEQLIEEIGLSEEDAVMIVNMMPRNKDELRPILFRSYPLLDAKSYDRILEILKSLEEGEER
ncbi:MAG TPA: hypothetical protein EYP68_01455 [Candidatus Korarchaeota archaeon]|nr:hypothetical protein [Candidatus Korarchaeota archaeon]